MTCIIHYDGLQKYDELSSVTEKTAEKILLAKRLQDDSNDDHVTQCKGIPSGDLQRYSFHRNPCYKKFVWITVNSTNISTNNPTRVSVRSSGKTRSTRKSSSKLHVLSSPKRKRQKLQSPTRQVRCRDMPSVSTTLSRNKFVFGSDCVVCGKYELRYKNKDRDEVREYPLLLTLDGPAEKIRDMLQKKDTPNCTRKPC